MVGLRVWDEAKWMVCHSNHKCCLQRLLLVICQFSESERWGTSDCEHIYLFSYLRKAGKDQESISLHETPSLIGSLAQPELVEWLVGGRGWCWWLWLGGRYDWLWGRESRIGEVEGELDKWSYSEKGRVITSRTVKNVS